MSVMNDFSSLIQLPANNYLVLSPNHGSSYPSYSGGDCDSIWYPVAFTVEKHITSLF